MLIKKILKKIKFFLLNKKEDKVVLMQTIINTTKKKQKHKKYYRKNRKISRCYVTGKVCMNETKAKNKVNTAGFLNARAYKCEFCNFWHLTHKKNKLKMH